MKYHLDIIRSDEELNELKETDAFDEFDNPNAAVDLEMAEVVPWEQRPLGRNFAFWGVHERAQASSTAI
jgi:hypothetical protein